MRTVHDGGVETTVVSSPASDRLQFTITDLNADTGVTTLTARYDADDVKYLIGAFTAWLVARGDDGV